MAPVSDVDPFCRDFFENPFPAHQELREAGPAVRLSRYGVWAVARYAEVHMVLNDWQTFCSSRGAGLTDFAKEQPWRPKSLVLEADPPMHDRTRRVLNRVLSAAVVRGLRERFTAEADQLIDELLERGSCDAIADLAEAYPLTVFPDAMGMPRENRHFLLPYGNMVFNSFGPRNEFFETAVGDAEPVLAWLQRQMQRDAFAPGGFGAGIHAAAEAGELTEEEAPLVARSLLSAGVDTTVSGIGAAVYCLARFPDQFARLRADPSLARAAFEEAVRYESPVQTFFRTTTRMVEIRWHSTRRGREGADVSRRRQPRPAALGAPRGLRHRTAVCRACRVRQRHSSMRRPAIGAAGRRMRAFCIGPQSRLGRDHRSAPPALQ